MLRERRSGKRSRGHFHARGTMNEASPGPPGGQANLSPSIHPTAVVHPRAQVGPGCLIGPYCVIGEAVSLGAHCRLHAHVVIDGLTALGHDNEIFPFASIGLKTQDLKWRGGATRTRM